MQGVGGPAKRKTDKKNHRGKTEAEREGRKNGRDQRRIVEVDVTGRTGGALKVSL